MNTRRECIQIVLASIFLVCTGCRSGSEKQSQATPGASGSGQPESQAPKSQKTKLVLNWVPEPEFGGFYAARDRGFYSQAGLEVEIQGGGAGVPVVQMVGTGQADFGVAGADDILVARTRGVDIVPLFAVFQTSPLAIMTHEESGASGMADVFSKGTLAIEPGTYFTAFLKKKHGFDKIKIVPYDGGVARFVAEKDFSQQCFVTSEPILARKKGAHPKVFLIADDGFNPYQTVVFTRGALVKQNHALIQSFVDATQKGWRSYLDEPDPVNTIMGKLNTSMDADTFKEAAAVQKPFIETEEAKKRGLGSMSKKRWEALGAQLAELGIIEKQPAFEDYNNDWIASDP